MSITEKSKKLFIDYVKDAGNWSGCPVVGGNVGGSKEDRGNLTHLKKLGLVVGVDDEETPYIVFTKKGFDYACKLGLAEYLEESDCTAQSEIKENS